MKRLLPLVLLAAAASADEIVPPQVENRVETVAPADALQPGEQALVVLGVTVDPDGRVTDVEVVQSGGPVLDAAASDSVRKWTFKPARRGDQNIAAKIKVGINFNGPPTPTATPTSDSASDSASDPASDSASASDPDSDSASASDSDRRRRARPRRHRARPRPPAQPRRLRLSRSGRRARRGAAQERHRAPQARARHPAHQRRRRGARRAGLPARLRRARGPGHRVHRRRRADQRERQPARQRLRRHALHHPRAGRVAARASRGRSIRGRATTPSPAAPTTSSASRSAASPPSTRPAASAPSALLAPLGPAGREHAHLRRRRALQDRRLRPEPRRPARPPPMGQYEGKLGDDGTLPPRHERLHDALTTRRASSARTTTRPARSASTTATTSSTTQRSQGGDASRYSLAADLETQRGDVTHHQQVFCHPAATCACARTSPASCSTCRSRSRRRTPARRPARPRRARADHRRARLRAHAPRGARPARRSSSSATSRAATTSHGTQQRLEAATGHPYHDRHRPRLAARRHRPLRRRQPAPLRWLTLRGGVRADLLTYDVLDNCAGADASRTRSPTNPPVDPSCLAQQDFGRHREPDQQVTAVGHGAPAARLAARRAVRRASPSRRATARACARSTRSTSRRTSKTPFASIDAYEGGVALRARVGGVAAGARSALFQTHVDRDLIFSETVGRATCSASARRAPAWRGLGVAPPATSSTSRRT